MAAAFSAGQNNATYGDSSSSGGGGSGSGSGKGDDDSGNHDNNTSRYGSDDMGENNGKNNNDIKGSGNNSSVGSSSGGSTRFVRGSTSMAAAAAAAAATGPSASQSIGERSSGSLLDFHDEDSNLRTTCDGCTLSKIKCDGGHPCKRCQRRKSECVYSEKKRCGPKRRRSAREESEDDSDATGGGMASHDGDSSAHGHAGPKVLTTRERRFLAKFYGSVNKFIPMTCVTVIRDAMNPLPLDVIDGISVSEVEKHIHHARKAVLLGCVAVGAVFCGDAAAAGAYMAQAQIHLKDCFDALLPEVVSCYLVMVVYHLHFLDRSKVFRYIGFAQQAYRELVPSKQPEAGYLRDSVRMLSTFLHVACNSDIRVEEIDLRAESRPEPGTNGLSRILAVFSHVLLMLYRRSDKKASPVALLSLESLAVMADEADTLLSMIEDPGSFAVIVMKTLRGYFLLLKGREDEVLNLVALPVAKALAADNGVLHFPLCWHMCQCMSAFLRRKGVFPAAASMDQVMDPLKQTLAYAGSCCRVALDVFSVYAGKGPIGAHSSLFSTIGQHHPAQGLKPDARVAESHFRGGIAGGIAGGDVASGREAAGTSSVAPQDSSPAAAAAANAAQEAARSQAAAAEAAVGAAAAAAAAAASSQSREQQQQQEQRRRQQERDRDTGERSAKRRSDGRTARGSAVGAWGFSAASAAGSVGVAGVAARESVSSAAPSPSTTSALSTTAANVDGLPLDGGLFGSSSAAAKFGGAAVSTPAGSSGHHTMNLAHIELDDVGSLPRHQMMFDLDSPQQPFELGAGSREAVTPDVFNMRDGLGTVGRGNRAGITGDDSGGGRGAGPAPEAGQHAESAGSSPLEGGLSSDASPTRPAGAADGGDTDSGESGHLTGMLSGM